MPELFTLPAPLHDRLVVLALAAPDREVCALLGGPPDGGRATRLVPIENVAGTAAHAALAAGLGLDGRGPAAEYLMEPAALVRALRAFRSEGLREVAIFHSHPRGPATPSATDVRLAAYPHCVYLVCSLADPARPSLRGFRIAAGRAVEIALVVDRRERDGALDSQPGLGDSAGSGRPDRRERDAALGSQGARQLGSARPGAVLDRARAGIDEKGRPCGGRLHDRGGAPYRGGRGTQPVHGSGGVAAPSRRPPHGREDPSPRGA